MALTERNKQDIRSYLGWPSRFYQTDSALEQAMRALEAQPEAEAQITNAIAGDPPGLLALLRDLDSRLMLSHKRLKASVVGSITLNAGEVGMLRSEGRRLVIRMAGILGVQPKCDVFSVSTSGISGGGDNYIGK